MNAQRATPTPVLRAASAASLALSMACCFAFCAWSKHVGDALLRVRLAHSGPARNELSEIGLVPGGKIAVIQSPRHDPTALRCRGGLIALSRFIAAPKHIGEIGRRIAHCRSRLACRLPGGRADGFRRRARDVGGSAHGRTCGRSQKRSGDDRANRPNQEPMRGIAKEDLIGMHARPTASQSARDIAPDARREELHRDEPRRREHGEGGHRGIVARPWGNRDQANARAERHQRQGKRRGDECAREYGRPRNAGYRVLAVSTAVTVDKGVRVAIVSVAESSFR